MNTNDNGTVSVSSEVERYKSDKLVSEAVVENEKNRLAQEFGGCEEIKHMKLIAATQPQRYKIPKSAKRDGMRWKSFVEKLRKIFGVE